MNISASAEYGIAGKNIRKNLNMIAGGKSAYDFSIFIDRHTVNKYPVTRNLAFKQSGNTGFAVQGFFYTVRSFRREI